MISSGVHFADQLEVRKVTLQVNLLLEDKKSICYKYLR